MLETAVLLRSEATRSLGRSTAVSQGRAAWWSPPQRGHAPLCPRIGRGCGVVRSCVVGVRRSRVRPEIRVCAAASAFRINIQHQHRRRPRLGPTQRPWVDAPVTAPGRRSDGYRRGRTAPPASPPGGVVPPLPHGCWIRDAEAPRVWPGASRGHEPALSPWTGAAVVCGLFLYDAPATRSAVGFGCHVRRTG